MRALRDFQCLNCGKIYEEFAVYDETRQYADVICPACQSKDKEVLFLKVPSVTFSNPVGTDRWHSDSKGHDYRYKYNLERPGGVKDQRATAEKLSHMGTTSDIYQDIDDISSGKYFGEVQ